MTKYAPIEQRLWGRVDRSNNMSCWPFPNNKGHYGRIQYGGPMDAHKVAWIVTYGEVPKGMNVLHKCDNKSCINPKHLELGTHTKNFRDAQNRIAFNGNGKLTREQVKEIKESHLSVSALAKKFGVGKTTIYRCKNKGNKHEGCVGENKPLNIEQYDLTQKALNLLHLSIYLIKANTVGDRQNIRMIDSLIRKELGLPA